MSTKADPVNGSGRGRVSGRVSGRRAGVSMLVEGVSASTAADAVAVRDGVDRPRSDAEEDEDDCC